MKRHGELKSGPRGKGGKVKSRRQAIAIALEEAGASKYETRKKNRRNLARTKAKEATGRTAQQETGRQGPRRRLRQARDTARDGRQERQDHDVAALAAPAHRAKGRLTYFNLSVTGRP
jgi:hypothetical protein